MLDTHVRQNGYCEIFPPFLVNAESLFGTGQLPKSRDQMYYIGEDELFLHSHGRSSGDQSSPRRSASRRRSFRSNTAPIAPAFGGKRDRTARTRRVFCAFTSSTRSSLSNWSAPETSYEELEKLRADAEGILKALGLALPCFGALRRRPFLCRGKMLRFGGMGAGRKEVS
jgi:seryl-tRNA synthetase